MKLRPEDDGLGGGGPWSVCFVFWESSLYLLPLEQGTPEC